jgi:hypothetical protein
MTKSGTAHYAFPHSGADERRRLTCFRIASTPHGTIRQPLPGRWIVA